MELAKAYRHQLAMVFRFTPLGPGGRSHRVELDCKGGSTTSIALPSKREGQAAGDRLEQGVVVGGEGARGVGVDVDFAQDAPVGLERDDDFGLGLEAAGP